MRPLLLGLAFVGVLAAQSEVTPAEVPMEQCLPGTLISIQPDSITLKFNAKITTMRLAPDAEIWRRGTDVESIHQLAVGDDIHLRCSPQLNRAVRLIWNRITSGKSPFVWATWSL